MILASTIAVLLWLSMIIYAIFGGADFGAGFWDGLAFGSPGREQRRLIRAAIGPVWEANNVWLTYLIVGLFNAFPFVTQVLVTALFIPIVLILIGIVMRGASFAFRSQILHATALRQVWRQTFDLASLISPFLFGASAAAVASGSLHIVAGQIPVGLIRAWLTPFAIVVGLMGVALCATLAAVFLTVEAQIVNSPDLMRAFRLRALVAGAVTACLGLAGLLLAPTEAPILWRGMLDHALWAVAITMLLGIATGAALWFWHFRLARALVSLETGALFGTWGLSQLPYLIPPDLTISNTASPPITLLALLVVGLIGMMLLIPALWFLFFVFKGENFVPRIHGKEIEHL